MKLAFISLYFLVLSINAQELYELKGEVFDENGVSISVGDILVFQEAVGELVKYSTILEGTFSIEGVSGGKYLLKVSALGFESYQENISVSSNMTFTINLKTSTTNLKEVEVVGAKNPITYEGGNLKVDVQSPYFSSIPDPVDLLSRLPGIQVAANREAISVLGKGSPLIYLGNQRISLEEFSALPIDGIETIELIDNPSVKYEAEGRAVVLVRLKKSTGQGFRGSIQETASQRRNFNNYLAWNSSYAKENWTLRGSMGYNQLLQWESNSFLFKVPEREVSVDYLVLIPRNVRVQLNPGLGFYYQWNEADYLSLNASARLQTDNAPFFTDTFIVDRGNEQLVTTNTENDNRKDYYSASFNFNKQLTNSWNLFTGVQYAGFRQLLDAQMKNSIDNSDFTLDEIRQQEYSINSLAFRLDMEKVLAKNLKWEWGVNVNQAKADAFTEIENISAATESLIDFVYEEELYAAYHSLSGKLNKTTDFEAGLRVEHNEVLGSVASEVNPVISRTTTNIFPKANISIVLDSTQSLSFNFARNISRPDFSRASTITVFINPFLEGTGNVNLRPTLTNEFSANYQRGKTSFFTTYYQSSNPTNFTISYDEGMDTALLSLVNLDQETGFYTGITLPYTKGIWTSNNTLTLNYNQLKDSEATFSSVRPYLYFYTNHQFKIAKDTTLVFGTYALGQRQVGIFKRNAMAIYEASISKTFFKNWDCTLRLNDITRAMNFEESYALSGVVADGVYFADGREIALSIKYRFGNSVSSTFKNRNVDENIDRIK